MSESFAQLFEESLKGLETRQGSIVSGTVVAIQKGFVLVDAGLKSESAIPVAEFQNAQGELEVKVGDTVKMVTAKLNFLVRKQFVTNLGLN